MLTKVHIQPQMMQTQDVVDDADVKEEAVIIAPDLVVPAPVEEDYMRVTCINQIMKRTVPVLELFLPEGNYVVGVNPSGFLHGGTDPGFSGGSLPSFFARAYAAWHGQWEVKSIGEMYTRATYYPTRYNVNTAEQAFLQSDVPAGGSFGFTGPLTLTGDRVGYLELVVPYKSIYPVCRIPRSAADHDIEHTTGCLVFNIDNSNGPLPAIPKRWTLLSAAGDDTTFHGFLGPPDLVWNAGSYKQRPSVFKKAIVRPEMFRPKLESAEGNIGIAFKGTAVAAPTGGVATPTRYNAPNMSERGITFEELASREQLTRVLNWSISDVGMVPLSIFNMPGDVLNGSSNKRVFDAFRYWRGMIKIRVQINSNVFQQGRLTIAWFPLATPAEAAILASSRERLSTVNHINLKAGGTVEGTLLVPYLHPKNHIRVSEDESIGCLVITPFNELRVGAALPPDDSCRVSIFVSFPEASFQVLNPEPPSVQQGEEFKMVEMRPEMGAAVSKVKAITSAASDARDMMNYGVDKVIKVGGLIEAEVHHPTVTSEVIQNVQQQYSRFVNVDGMHGGTMLDTFMHSGAIVSKEASGVVSSETDIDDLQGRPCFLATFTVGTTQLAGDLVFRIPMTIAPHVLGAFPEVPFTPTLSGFVSAAFDFWRGDIVLDIELIAPKVSTVRLFIGIIYGGSIVPIDLVDITANYGSVMDFNAENAVASVHIPFRAPVEMLRVPRPGDSDPSTCTLGEMAIWVINPYVGNPTIAPTADVNIHMRMVPCQGASHVELTYLGGSVSEFRAT